MYQRDLNNGASNVNDVINNGRGLLEGRESVRGSTVIRAQIESIEIRWETLVKKSENRQNSLEHAFSTRFQDEVKRVRVWIDQRSTELDQLRGQDPAKIKTYINVWLYSQIFL